MKKGVGYEHASFLGSIFITVLTSQATMVVDAVIGGNLLGADVVSAVDLVLPLEGIFTAMVLLLGRSASAVSSFEFGRGNTERVERYFTAAVVSLTVVLAVLGVAVYAFRDAVVRLLCDDSYLGDLTGRYLAAMIPFFITDGLLTTVKSFTAMTGKPQRVLCCSVMQFAVNVSFNLLFVMVAGLGIKALAYSSVISSVAGIVYLFPRCARLAHCSIHELWSHLCSSVRCGGSFLAIQASYIFLVYSMNSFVLDYAGEEGLFCWSVIMMLFLAGDYAVSAGEETVVSLGGRYAGSGDLSAVRSVHNRSLLFEVLWTGGIIVSVLSAPSAVLPFFGVSDVPAHPGLVRSIIFAVPFIFGVNTVRILLIGLLNKCSFRMFAFLGTLNIISAPVLFFIFDLLLPDCVLYAFLALIPLQAALCMAARKV